MYVQPHIGGDIALLTGVAKEVLERRRAGRRRSSTGTTEGFDAFRRAGRCDCLGGNRSRSPASTETTFAGSPTMYVAGEERRLRLDDGDHAPSARRRTTCKMIANLALLRGMVGRPHAGLMPIRGHSNVQGIGSVGVTPALKQAMLERFEQRLGRRAADVAGPRHDGLHGGGRARARWTSRCAWAATCTAAIPTPRFAEQAIQQARRLVVYLTTTLNTGHAWGTGDARRWILPVLPRDEEPQPTTQESMFSYRAAERRRPAAVSTGRAAKCRSWRNSAAHVLPDDPARSTGQRLESHDAIRATDRRADPRLRSRSTTSTRPSRSSTSPGRAVDRPGSPRRPARPSFTPSPSRAARRRAVNCG